MGGWNHIIPQGKFSIELSYVRLVYHLVENAGWEIIIYYRTVK